MNVALVLISTSISLGALILLDRFLGIVLVPKLFLGDLIGLPESSQEFHTSEFRYVAVYNQYGFRSRSSLIDCTHGKTIVTLGDSFTWGWGVSEDESWPTKLEQILRRGGLEVCLYNLGRGGLSVDGYARIATRAIPVLRPNLVIVGVLQGDDLAQLRPDETEIPPSNSSETLQMFKRLAETVLPNSYYLFKIRCMKRQRVTSAEQNRDRWLAAANQVLSGLSPEEKKRYEAIPQTARLYFEHGALNPSLVSLALKRSNRFLVIEDDTDPQTKIVIVHRDPPGLG